MTTLEIHLDHTLIHLNNEDFESPPSWLSNNFNIVEGGTHANGRTRNKLIILPDGNYIELLNSINNDPNDIPGVFALTSLRPSTATDNFHRLSEALASKPLGVSYSPPQAGGRRTPQGVEVRWEVVLPKYEGPAKGPTDVPFFCHDVTERGLRVPLDWAVGHGSGAVGLAGIEVVVPAEKFGEYVGLYEGVLGVAPKVDGDKAEFGLRAPVEVDSWGVVRVRRAKGEEDEKYLGQRGVGVVSLFVRVEGGQELELKLSEHYLR